MVFNVTISLGDLKAKNGKNYAILLADTVIVRTNTPPENLTAKIPRKYEEISYALQGDEEVEEKKKSTSAPANSKQTSK